MYQERIRQELARTGRIGTNPAAVECFMRIEHGTLDGLSASQFAQEVAIGAACCDECSTSDLQALMDSYGMEDAPNA